MQDNLKKRAVICVRDPEAWIPQLHDYSIMVVNPNSTESRKKYLLDHADWSLLITDQGIQYREGQLYNEKLFWYTSGTTGDSKFCSFTQEQLEHTANIICQSYNLNSNDRYVSIMPLWHAHGQGFYWATKLAGCEQKFLSIQDLRSLPDLNPTFVTAIPDILKLVCNFNLPNLRFIRSASSPLSNELYTVLQSKFSVPVVEAFGMTEALSHCFTNPLNGEQRIGTVGLPDGIEAKIVDQHLYIRGPSLFTPGWYNTGDLAETDSKGYYKILGRQKDQINIRGIKLNPVSIEQQLIDSVPGLKECVVFGDNKVKCLYVGDCTQTDLYNFLISLGKHCRPHLVTQVDTIPLSPSGKVSRTFLNLHYQ